MADLINLLNLIDEKNKLCRNYEVCSESLLVCDDDSISDKIAERADLAHRIDQINSMIEDFYRTDDNSGEIGKKAVQNSVFRNELPEEYKAVFDRAQAGFACLNRVKINEPVILERLESIRHQLDQQLRSMSNTPKILKYLKTGTSVPTDGILFRNQI
jgi:hypothetical protein